jgi:hypothetical protein
MATEQQGPPAPEGRPEDLPPTGWIQRPGMFDAVFRRHHEEQLRGYMVAVTSQLYQRGPAIVLPYHYDVLAIARQFLDADKDDVAVIMAQTACEITTDDVITTLLRHHNVPDVIQKWIKRHGLGGSTTLLSPELYDLYPALSRDDLRRSQKALWKAYERRAERRNVIVHAGGHAAKPQAVEACETALDLIHHFEAVRARVVK